ncbi:hypothetical protein, conserved [Trypanosoma brucei brucei TREU927]|uniref:Uncharacterized protein n=1 Tax=Trypanosoma brucei brucei (strain 927/4 GUTat10.1) TaxID=185431 RepID=Q387J9_TRYB2|nr:hypothetical protein, conserved [Trypanosoma brucei brucei TREU927]EAN79032.1 hypothetical protein, conserved [Trypanosoma brucei brucei TREU927]
MSNGGVTAFPPEGPSLYGRKPGGSFYATLFSSGISAGFRFPEAPRHTSQLLVFLSNSINVAGAAVIGMEEMILKSVRDVLQVYNELGGDGTGTAPCLHQISLENLRSLADCFAHRPLLGPRAIGALLRMAVLVVKYAPLDALCDEGCNILNCLLQLLSCLPRSTVENEPLSILRVTRITIRNAMRRIGPCIAGTDGETFQGRICAGASVTDEALERDIIPWMEKHLLPLHIVTGDAARVELREDRHLALALLSYLPLNSAASSHRVALRLALLYLAETVAALLKVDAAVGGVEGTEREQACMFLRQANINFSSYSSVNVNLQTDEDAAGGCCITDGPPVPAAAVEDFLLAQEAAYRRDFTQLERCINREHDLRVTLERCIDEAKLRSGLQ